MKRLLLVGLTAFLATAACAKADAPARSEPSFADSMNAAGRDIGYAARAGSNAVKEVAKEAWHNTSHAAAEAGHAIKQTAHEAWDGTREAFSSPPKKSGHN